MAFQSTKIKEMIIGDVRIVPHGNAFFIELTYEVTCSTTVLLDGSRACLVPKLSRVTVYGASEKSEALFYGEASAEGGNPVTMSISF